MDNTRIDKTVYTKLNNNITIKVFKYYKNKCIIKTTKMSIIYLRKYENE